MSKRRNEWGAWGLPFTWGFGLLGLRAEEVAFIKESIRDIFVTLVANSLIEFFSKVELITNDTYVIFSFVFFKKNIAFSMYLNLFLYTNTLIFLYNKKVLS
ncbi:hypothetical protein Ahy_B01g055536 isoform F [Arachis hypogaea]|uniref:Uncharacterized protein n=1 Tax=Arachis hypogaea TaxID=3818 RepID=A0A445AWM1_ARAHY|nr:hypothetical protein Ahy_B01g055536 isoform F [Arachis hypogaea]